MIDIHFAPIQGYTDSVYRKAHCELAGGVSMYYTPFIRLEHGEVRRRDIRDISSQNNAGVPLVPQIIAADVSELKKLTDVIRDCGYQRIDRKLWKKLVKTSSLARYRELTAQIGVAVKP